MILSLVLMALMQQPLKLGHCRKLDNGCSECMEHIGRAEGVVLHCEPKPPDARYCMSEGGVCREVAPMDVPAIQIQEGSSVMWRWGCKNKRRVLLTAENGDKHCVLFQP